MSEANHAVDELTLIRNDYDRAWRQTLLANSDYERFIRHVGALLAIVDDQRARLSKAVSECICRQLGEELERLRGENESLRAQLDQGRFDIIVRREGLG